MLSFASIAAGVAMLLFVLVDVFLTVFLIGGGAGPQTQFVADRIWRGALRLHNPTSERSHSRLRIAGPAILLLAVVLWVVELTVGWALVNVPEAFDTALPVGFDDRVVFAVRQVVGRARNADMLVPRDGVWDVLDAFAGSLGVVFISLVLAYVLPVLNAVAQKRSAAAHINTLGHSIEAMRTMVDESEDGGEIVWHLETATVSIASVAERHRSYPVLHYFHSKDPHAALAPAVAKLGLLVGSGVPGAPRVDATVLRPLARSLHDLLGAVQGMGLAHFAFEHDDVDHESLRDVGIEPLSATVHNPPSRDWLFSYVQFDGWQWDSVIDEAAAAQDWAPSAPSQVDGGGPDD